MSVKVRPYVNGGWEVDVALTLPDGRKIRDRRKAPVSTRTEALRWGRERERELLVRGPQTPRKEVPTLEEFAPSRGRRWIRRTVSFAAIPDGFCRFAVA